MDTTTILDRLDRIEQLLSFQKEVLSFEEACAYTGFSRSYLYKLTASGDIPHSKPKGKLIYFERAKLNVWLLQNPIRGQFEIEEEALRHAFKLQK
ncbi:helix-turn-helix domain-containing protein [Robiginitalea sediminis]|uniref:helix-turn-helix domain-containing protein n=1 Tax=Robiginitalea sediminis TaxID=1982593 RepID=UPI000B4B33CB|nr:helix-turn-helix domain-containing protein [Robiginitalea sediminis]